MYASIAMYHILYQHKHRVAILTQINFSILLDICPTVSHPTDPKMYDMQCSRHHLFSTIITNRVPYVCLLSKYCLLNNGPRQPLKSLMVPQLDRDSPAIEVRETMRGINVWFT